MSSASPGKQEGEIAALTRDVVDSICAAQVVTSLSQCVKELLENSLDAGASSITITLVNNGIDMISVSDDGCGVSEENWSTLCRWHATSKVDTLDGRTDDLRLGYSDFGFRGEALAAMCGLSNGGVIVLTRTGDSQLGLGRVLVYDKTGRLASSDGEAARGVGTTVTVRGLFKGLPVRLREFERSAKKQVTATVELIQAYAVIRHDVAFRLSCDGRSLLATNAESDMDTAIRKVCCLSPAELLGMTRIELNGEDSRWTLKAWLSPPTSVVRPGVVHAQWLYVGGRPVDMPVRVSRTINQLYKRFQTTLALERKSGRTWIAVLSVELGDDVDAADVNSSKDKRAVILDFEAELCDKITERVEEDWSSASSQTAVQVGSSCKQQRRLDDWLRKDDSIMVKAPTKKEEQCARTQRQEQWTPRSAGRPEVPAPRKSIITPPARHSDCPPVGDLIRVSVPPSTQLRKRRDSLDTPRKEPRHETDSPASALLVRTVQDVLAESARKSRNSEIRDTTQSEIASEPCEEEESPVEVPASIADDSHRETVGSGDSRTISSSLSDDRLTADITTQLRSRAGDSFAPSESSGVTESSAAEIQEQMEDAASDVGDFKVGDGAGELISASRKRQREESPESIGRKLMKVSTPPDDQAGDEFDQGFNATFHVKLGKKHFEAMRVIGQFNKGFIITVLEGRWLFILDQHACDEKTIFETLNRTSELKSQPMVVPVRLSLPPPIESCIRSSRKEIEVSGSRQSCSVMALFYCASDTPSRRSLSKVNPLAAPLFQACGFRFNFDDEAPIGSRVQLTSLGVASGLGFERSRPLTKEDFVDLASLLLDRGATGRPDDEAPSASLFWSSSLGHCLRPPRVWSMLASRACRTAIMIGDSLGRKKMEGVVRKMAGLNQPWNCPHGRPTMRLLAKLSACGRGKDTGMSVPGRSTTRGSGVPYGSPVSSASSPPGAAIGDLGPSPSTRAILNPQEGVVVKGDMAIIAICKHLNGMAGSKGGFILRELDDNTLFCKTSVQDWLRMDVSKELSKLLSLGEDSPADGRSPDDNWGFGATPPDSSVDGGSSSRRAGSKKRGRRTGTSVSTSKRTKKW
ncbi:ATP-binding mismatch repair protein [Perkinsus olseni]|uniref:ATP-binding mismatch repair protein n=1 Tax=Perkinsus olseni TaxID=32597 RepID=A0A7J6MJ58_PEROL|nr:ATP-binding mismatch repair protein [Perkinsus olseni]